MMPYRPLRLPEMRENVRDFVRAGIEPSLYDVHSMLRLPLPHPGCEANCGFSIVMVLNNVVSGASTLLFDSVGASGKRFVNCLAAYFPWEPDELLIVESAEGAGRLVYKLFRNPFAHSFGLETAKIGKGERQRVMLTKRSEADRVAVGRLRPFGTANGLQDDAIEEIEYAQRRPHWLLPTIQRDATVVNINAEPFYRGVRLMIERLCADPQKVEHASRFLASGT